jgi:hypothetical protein
MESVCHRRDARKRLEEQAESLTHRPILLVDNGQGTKVKLWATTEARRSGIPNVSVVRICHTLWISEVTKARIAGADFLNGWSREDDDPHCNGRPV